MERIRSQRALRLAIAAGLGLCLSLPLAAQDTAPDARPGDRAGQASTRTAPAKAADKRFLDKATQDNEKEVAAATLGQQKAGAPDVRTYAEHLLRDHQDMLVKLDETAVALGVATDRRYVAMNGWGSGPRDDARPNPARDAVADKATSAAGGTTTAGSVTGRGTSATTTSSAGAGTGYETGTMASTDRNASATTMTTTTGTQAVPASASEDPAVRKLAAQSGAAFDKAFVDHMVMDHRKAIAEFERASKDDALSEETRTLASNALPKLRNHLAMAETLQVNLKTAQ